SLIFILLHNFYLTANKQPAFIKRHNQMKAPSPEQDWQPAPRLSKAPAIMFPQIFYLYLQK
ncbi:hypothetical protein, partial [uncultured Muribaculum sp.]|uniref:hypothetical protein n=1 Tax=uncultured Muribaculum sp. TaxID=1918613 RepID=UPI0025B64A48